MSIQPDSSPVPEWDVADRMRKALRVAHMTPGQMAEYIGVGGNTVSTWINGRIKPSKQTLRLWALRCGVSFEWLTEGTNPTSPPSPGGGVSAGRKGVMNPCSRQGQNGGHWPINLSFRPRLLPIPLAA